ncbi:MAG: hypothetical protein ACLFPL_01255 [Candidatus Nanoarchaeia archaeon]
MEQSKKVTILYTNWKGETAQRTIIPQSIEFTSNQWHTQEQWILTAWDVEKKNYRHFPMKDIKKWS